MVIGGKSSGKSSANRFILNSLLNNGHKKVYWFELDPGQPEFNLSGWLNLVEVKKARIGPGFAFLNSDLHFKSGFRNLINKQYFSLMGLKFIFESN